MKSAKILSACAASLLIASGVSAYEAKATVKMEGNIIKQTHDKDKDAEYSVFNLNSHDGNGITFDVDSGIAGAHFELFYNMDGTQKAEDGWAISAKGTNLWFTPIDQLKVKLGFVGNDSLFVERVDDEKTANPFAYYDAYGDLLGRGVPTYITNADVDEMGLSVEVTPIENLTVSAAVAPGINKPGILNDGNDTTYTSWGVTASYKMDNFLFGAAYRDNGKESWKVIRLGASYEAENFYVFVAPNLGIEYISSRDEYEMNGVGLDLYGEYVMDAWKFYAHLPVTIRTTGSDFDPSYIEPFVKAEYNMGSLGLFDDFTPYLQIGTLDRAYTLDDNFADSFNMKIKPGVSCKISECEIGLGFEAQIHRDLDNSEKFTWAVPFTTKITF